MNKFIVIKCGTTFWSSFINKQVSLNSATFYGSVEEAEKALGNIPRNIKAEVGFLYFAPVDSASPEKDDVKTKVQEGPKQPKAMERWPKTLHPYEVDPSKYKAVWLKSDSGLSYDLWLTLNNNGYLTF